MAKFIITTVIELPGDGIEQAAVITKGSPLINVIFQWLKENDITGNVSYILTGMKNENEEGLPAPPGRRNPLPRGGVKDVVIRLIAENTERGLVAGELVDLAKAQGVVLDRQSVSSLLSKLKMDGVLDYDGTTYRLAKKTAPIVPLEAAE